MVGGVAHALFVRIAALLALNPLGEPGDALGELLAKLLDVGAVGHLRLGLRLPALGLDVGADLLLERLAAAEALAAIFLRVGALEDHPEQARVAFAAGGAAFSPRPHPPLLAPPPPPATNTTWICPRPAPGAL